MGLSAAGGMGFGGSSFGVRGVGGAAGGIPGVPRGAAGLPSASTGNLSDADPLGAFQQQSPHRGFFEMSPGGLPTMVGYSNMGRFPGYPGGTGGGPGGGEGGSGVGGGAEDTYSDEEVEGNLDDIKIEEGAGMEEDVIGDDDATGSGIGEEDEEDDDSGEQNHVDQMAAMGDAFP